MVNWQWDETDPVSLAAYVLWRLNHIHPFINGNGRTARAACYFVLCVKAESWLHGNVILPELLRRHRPQYVKALKQVDKTALEGDGEIDLTPLHVLISKLLDEQLSPMTK